MTGRVDTSWDFAAIWNRSRENWHWPQLPAPRIGSRTTAGEFPFENYFITLREDVLSEGPEYLENLFDHLIVHYVFCPRSLETAGLLALSAIKGLKEPSRAHCIVNVFADIVVDSFRLERSPEDERKVLLGWRRLAGQDLSSMDKLVLGFLREYWGVPLPGCDLPEVDLLLQVFSIGVRNKGLWARQCQQTARILEPFVPGILGKGPIRSLEILNGNADEVSMAALASELDPEQYHRALDILGLKGDLKRWYRDQSYCIEIKGTRKARMDQYPSGMVRWRHDDPLSDLDVAFSLGMSPWLVPGVTTYKRGLEQGLMVPGRQKVPDLLVVLDSSRSMDGHVVGSKTHRATLAAFKACQFAHQEGAELAAINFSDRSIVQPWTRNLSAVEDVLVEHICARTHIPGAEVLELASARKGCLILCITDTHIQNLYTEWEYLKEAAKQGDFVLFCIDQAGKDKYVEEALGSLGAVYYINRLDDLIGLVVETVRGKFYLPETYRRSGMPG